MSRDNTGIIFFAALIIMFFSSCAPPPSIIRDSLSYNYSGFEIAIGRTNKEDIQKYFGRSLFIDKSASDEETGRPSETWLYFSIEEKEIIITMKMRGFKFNDKALLNQFVIFEGKFNEGVFVERIINQEQLNIIEVGKTTKEEIGAKYGAPDLTFIGGPSKITGTVVEAWMYLTRFGQTGGAFIALGFDKHGKVFNHKVISMEDIRDIEKMFKLGD